MKRTIAVSALVLCLAACSEDAKTKQDKNCIDPVTYANVCIENAIAEQQRVDSAYLDQKFKREDRQIDFNSLPVEEQKQQVANGTAPTIIHNHNHSSSGTSFVTGMLVGHLLSGPSAQPTPTFRPTAPVRPLGPPPAPFYRSQVLAPVKRFSVPVAAAIQRVVRPAPVTVPKVAPKAPIRTIPLSSGTYTVNPVPKPNVVVTPKVTAPPPKVWSAPKVTTTPTYKAPTPSYKAPSISFGKRR